MAVRFVGIPGGRGQKVAVLRMELDEDWVHLRALPDMGHAQACRVLYHLHLQYQVVDIPHRLSIADDATGLQYIDGMSVPRTLVEEYVFPRLTGLADIADSVHGVH